MRTTLFLAIAALRISTPALALPIGTPTLIDGEILIQRIHGCHWDCKAEHRRGMEWSCHRHVGGDLCIRDDGGCGGPCEQAWRKYRRQQRQLQRTPQ